MIIFGTRIAGRLAVQVGDKLLRDGKPVEIMTDVEAFGVRKPCAFRMGLGVESWLN